MYYICVPVGRFSCDDDSDPTPTTTTTTPVCAHTHYYLQVRGATHASHIPAVLWASYLCEIIIRMLYIGRHRLIACDNDAIFYGRRRCRLYTHKKKKLKLKKHSKNILKKKHYSRPTRT